MRPLASRLALAALVAALPACSWFEKDKEPLPGERIPVLLLDSDLEVDPQIQDLDVILPPPEPNDAWPQPGGIPTHAMQHVTLSDSPVQAWRANAGAGSTARRRLTAPPVVAAGKVFTIDADSEVRAFDASNGNGLWRADVIPEDEDEGALGGGLSYYDGKIYVATSAAEVVALEAGSGNELWRRRVSAPMRSGPTLSGGRLFVVTVDNQLFALDARTGEELWTHAGITETASLLGSASPAVEGNVVVAPYSSGEIYALLVENGRPVWSDSLAALRRSDAVSALADIRGDPVIDRGMVFAVSHSGRTAAIDLRSGLRVWDSQVGGVEMPWVAGDFVFMLSNDNVLVCLSRQDGRIRWLRPLPRWEDEEDRKGPILWTGPILASDRLVIAGSDGEVWTVSPYTGEILGRIGIPDGVRVPPVVAGGTLYILTEDAELYAYR